VELRVPSDDLKRWRVTAGAEGLQLSEWIRRRCNEISVDQGVIDAVAKKLAERRARSAVDDRPMFNKPENMREQEHIMIENPENTREENIMLELTNILDAAGVPRTVPRDGAGINIEISLPNRVRLLMSGRDDATRQAVGNSNIGREAVESCDAAEANLFSLHIKLREMFGAESVADALESASTLKKEYDQCRRDRDFFHEQAEVRGTELTWFTQQRDRLTAEVKKLKAKLAAKPATSKSKSKEKRTRTKKR